MTRLIKVAYAAPIISNLGNPNSPKIRTAFNTTFMTFAITDIYIDGFVNPKPSINCLNVWNRMRGISDIHIISKYEQVWNNTS